VTTARSEELRSLAQRVADAFPPEVIEVVLTGSVSRGVADEASDIEMLAVTEEPLTLEQAFELARGAGLEECDSWGDPTTPTRRVFGYLDGQPVETVWWSRALADESYAVGGSAEALVNGVGLRTGGLLARWQEQLADYPDELAAERIEQAAERWGGFAPEGLLTLARPDCSLARSEWLVESAQRVLAIVFALNREHQPTAKRLGERVEPLKIKPERLAERMDAAFAEQDPRVALGLMTELQLDTVLLAPSGPNVDRARGWLAAALEALRRDRVRPGGASRRS
jgi:predicted nucleotidyltransferase